MISVARITTVYHDQSANANRRNINKEIIVHIDRGERERKINTEDLLLRAGQLRQKAKDHPITDAMLRNAKLAGRP
jgi:hypothetical protein